MGELDQEGLVRDVRRGRWRTYGRRCGCCVGGAQHLVEERLARRPFFLKLFADGAAHVDQQAEGERQVGVAVEVADGLWLAVDSEGEVCLGKRLNERALLGRGRSRQVTRRALTERVAVDAGVVAGAVCAAAGKTAPELKTAARLKMQARPCGETKTRESVGAGEQQAGMRQ